MVKIYKRVPFNYKINYIKDLVIKNAPVNKVMNILQENSPLTNFLAKFPIDMCDIIDLKIKKYRKGNFSCINKWHYDFVTDYDNPQEHEINYIWFNCINTQFHDIDTEPFTIYEYGRELHNGNYADEDCVRFLVRMSKTSSYNKFKLNVSDLQLLEQCIVKNSC